MRPRVFDNPSQTRASLSSSLHCLPAVLITNRRRYERVQMQNSKYHQPFRFPDSIDNKTFIMSAMYSPLGRGVLILPNLPPGVSARLDTPCPPGNELRAVQRRVQGSKS